MALSIRNIVIFIGGIAVIVGCNLTAIAQENFRVRAQISPVNETLISSELAAQIIKMTVREADSFNEGDILIELDCLPFIADLKKAEANVIGLKEKYSSYQRLEQLSSASQVEIKLSESEYKSALATVDILQAKVSKCIIKAPFKGRILKSYVNQHQFANVADRLLHIANDSDLEVELLVPSSWLRWLAMDTAFQIQIEELGQNIEAKVSTIGAEVNPVSQLIKIKGSLINQPPNILIGMSGDAIFTPPPVR